MTAHGESTDDWRHVFISHATNLHRPDSVDDKTSQRRRGSRQVLHSVINAIRDEQGLQPWYDEENIRLGAFWKQEIHEALFGCAAGVVLLDEDSFASMWVLKEVIVLMVRKSLTPSFPVVMILMDDMAVGQIRSFPHWGPLRVQDVQMLKLAAEPSEEDISRLAKNVTQVVAQAGPPPRTPFELWVDIVFAALKDLAELTTTLNDMSDRLGLRHADWIADNRRAVRCLARALLAIDDHRCLPEILDGLPLDLEERRASLANSLRPVWVPPQRAALMATTARLAPRQRCMILGTEDQGAAEDHMRRAECKSGRLKMTATVLAQGEDPRGDRLFAACRSAIGTAFGPAKNRTPTEFQELVTTYYRDTVLVLVLRADFIPTTILQSVVRRLHEAYYGLAVLLLADDPDVLYEELPDATLVTPIPEAGESDVRAEHHELLDSFIERR